MIIIFSGTDGAGKSTQINLLLKSLKNEKAMILWARGGYTPLFMFLKRIVRIIFGFKIPRPGITDSRKKMLEKKSVSRLWLNFAILDLFFYYGIYSRFLIYRGYTIIYDRHVTDTLIDFKRNFPAQFNENSLLWRYLIKTIPKANFCFLLHVPIEISMMRSKLKNEPFPDSAKTLKYRLESYMDESLFPSSMYHKIDCQQPVDTIHQEIQKIILNIA